MSIPGTCRRRSICCILLLALLPTMISIYYLTDVPYHWTGNIYIDLDNISQVGQTTTANKDPELPASPILRDNGPFCKPDECMQGKWVPRDPPFRSLADFRKKYPKSHRGIFMMCGSEENKRDEPDRRNFHDAQEKRLVEAMNWVWKPGRGRMRKWNAIEFTVRLLRSPGGLIFSGDSITRQQFQWLEYALARAGIFVTEDPHHLPSYSHRRLHQFILRPGDPMTTYLQDLAGVPDSRLQRPIYTKIDNHILIGQQEVREFSASLGAQDNFPWYDIFEYFEGWEDFVREAARRREEENVTEETILVLNTGAHWARSTWYMLPKTGNVHEEQARVTTAFTKMVGLISSRLEPVAHLSIFYRATAPGHPACPSSTFYKSFRVNSTISDRPGATEGKNVEYMLHSEVSSIHTEPYANASVARLMTSDLQQKLIASTIDQQHRISRSRWDWDRFEVHNTIWRESIAIMTRAHLVEPKGAKWHYMDIWDMSLQRPDAHTQNLVEPAYENYDCLHWCVPGVVEQWTEYLNHLIFWHDSE